jgi:hypothetical protein
MKAEISIWNDEKENSNITHAELIPIDGITPKENIPPYPYIDLGSITMNTRVHINLGNNIILNTDNEYFKLLMKRGQEILHYYSMNVEDKTNDERKS